MIAKNTFMVINNSTREVLYDAHRDGVRVRVSGSGYIVVEEGALGEWFPVATFLSGDVTVYTPAAR